VKTLALVTVERAATRVSRIHRRTSRVMGSCAIAMLFLCAMILVVAPFTAGLTLLLLGPGLLGAASFHGHRNNRARADAADRILAAAAREPELQWSYDGTAITAPSRPELRLETDVRQDEILALPEARVVHE
jgi:hypothetical protein